MSKQLWPLYQIFTHPHLRNLVELDQLGLIFMQTFCLYLKQETLTQSKTILALLRALFLCQ